MPRWSDLKLFCEREDWELYKDTDHYFYRKTLPDGSVIYTKIFRGSGEIPSRLWQLIRTHQLKVTQEEFNRKI